MTIEEANKRLHNCPYPTEVIIWSGKATSISTFRDKDFGEFKGILSNIVTGANVHPLRKAANKTLRNSKLTLPKSKAAARLSSKKPHLSIITWGGASTAKSTFKDLEYGLFTAKFSDVITGHRIHPNRKKVEFKSKRSTKVTEEEARARIAQIPYKIELIDWGGSATASSKFLVNEKILIISLTRLCKKTTFSVEEKKALSTHNWKDPIYKEKTIKGIQAVDWKPVQEKRKQTMLRKYNVEHALQNTESLNKAKQTTKSKYGEVSYSQSSEGREHLRKIALETGRTHIYNGNSMQEIAEKLGKAYSTIQAQIKYYGFEHFDKVKTRGTLNLVEAAFKEQLTHQGWSFLTQKKIGRYFVDFTIDNKVIVEVDGLFWHSDRILKDKTYSVKRKAFLENEGYKVLIFREDEVQNQTQIVLSIIAHNLKNSSNRIYARKTQVEDIKTANAATLFKSWHLMGSGAGRSLGLLYQGEIVAAIRYKKRKEGLEISRFACKPCWSVIGGFSKLIQAIQTRNPKKSILTFIDRRYGTGTYLKSLGFQKLPTYQSFKWTNGKRCWHRLSFRSSSGYAKGLAKLWDYGQTPWILNSNKS